MDLKITKFTMTEYPENILDTYNIGDEVFEVLGGRRVNEEDGDYYDMEDRDIQDNFNYKDTAKAIETVLNMKTGKKKYKVFYDDNYSDGYCLIEYIIKVGDWRSCLEETLSPGELKTIKTLVTARKKLAKTKLLIQTLKSIQTKLSYY